MEKQWSEMTWQEKREQRFKKWLSPAGVKFTSPETEKNYQARAIRMMKTIKMEIPDRVPVHLATGSIVAYNAGLTLQDVLYDYTKIKPAWIKFLNDYPQDTADGPGFFSRRAYEILDYKVNRWPGHGLPSNQTMQQFVE